MKQVLRTLVLLLLTSTAFAKPLQQVTVILDWFVNPDHAPLFVAQQQGYFKQQGLQVNIIAPANPNDGPKLVAAGKADMTISYQPSLLQQVEQGLPLMRVGALFAQNLNAIAVLKSGPIKTIADLKGKTIGMAAGNVDQALVGAMLQHHGLTLHDVTMVNVNYNLVQALLSHRVDAVTGIMRNVEPIEMQLAGHPARLFYPEKNGVPESDSEIWVTKNTDAHKPWVKKFLTAIQQGTIYLQAHPKKTWLRFAKNHPELNNEFNKRSWMATYKLFAVNPWYYNSAKYTAFARYMKHHGLIKTVPPLHSYVA